MLSMFTWTMIVLFIGLFTGYAIGSYLENQKHIKNHNRKDKNL